MDIDTIETDNVYDFRIKLNGEKVTFDEEIRLHKGDEIYINISRKDEYADSRLTLIGTDPNQMYDSKKVTDSILDEEVTEEEPAQAADAEE